MLRGLIVTALLLGGAVVVGDRVAAGAAEGLLEDAVQRSVGTPVAVDARLDTPFLPQFARGRYDEVLLELSGQLPGVRVDAATVRLTGAEVAPRDALSGDVQRVPVSSAQVRATVPYDELSRLAGFPVTSAGDGLVRLTGSVEVLGQEVSAAAVSALQVEGGVLRVRPQRFETGVDLADGLLERLAGDRFSVTVDLGALPFGLEPTAVDVAPGGVTVTATTGPTVLDTGSVPVR